MAAILTVSAMNGGPELSSLPAPGLPPGSGWEIGEGRSHNSMNCSEAVWLS